MASLLSVLLLAVLVAVLSLLSFAMAHAEVHVPDTLWNKPRGKLWLAIGMPTALFSKTKGQYLLLPLPLHALLQVRPLPEVVAKTIPETVQKASIHMIDLCIEHTVLLAGRDIKKGKFLQLVMPSSPSLQSSDTILQQIVLSYPGKYMSASKLNHHSKFCRDRGKQKVLMVFSALEHNHLGKIHQAKNKLSN